MEPTLFAHDLRPTHPRRRNLARRLWREWCFLRSLLERLWLRLLILAVVLLCGAVLFMRLEPERHHTFAAALFQTYSLVFGNAAEAFPRHWALQILFFLVPIVGLTVIIESIVETATLVRDRQRNERAWCRIMAESMRNHIVLVGLGRLGYRTYLVLRQLGVPVVVLELDDKNPFLSDVRADGAPLFLGDARRESLLVDANIAHARAIILATTDDLANLEVALDARRLNPGIRVVLRMFDQNMADKVREGFNIHTAMSQSAISAPAFATAALERGIVASTIIDHQLVVTAQGVIPPDSPLAGKSVAQALAQFGVQVVRIHAAGEPILFPLADTALASGSQVAIQGLHTNVGRALTSGYVVPETP